MSQWRSKIPYAATETWCSQIINKNKYFLKRGKFGQRHRHTEMMAMWMWKRRQRRRGVVNEPGTSWSHLSQKGQGESLPWSFSWSAAPPTPWLQNSGPQNSEAPFLLLEATTSGHLLQKPEETNTLWVPCTFSLNPPTTPNPLHWPWHSHLTDQRPRPWSWAGCWPKSIPWYAPTVIPSIPGNPPSGFEPPNSVSERP